MDTEQLTRLAGRADGVTGRADDRLPEVHARIRAHRRRRTAGAVLGAAALVVAVVTGSTLLTGSPDPAPDPAPGPNRIDPAPAKSVRPLTWTDEYLPSRRVHYGDQVIDTRLDLTDGDFKQMDLTDEGIVITTSDRRIWLADSSSVQPIADTHLEPGDFAEPEVTTGTSGSLAAWFDEVGRSQRLVVYDTARGRVVARHRCDLASCDLRWVGTDSVYWDAWNERPRRVDVATGEVEIVPQRVLVEEMLAGGRTLVVGDSFGDGTVTNGLDVTFVPQGSRLRGSVPGTTTPGPLTSTFDSTGNPVRLRLPDGYDPARSFTSFQWIDDDRLALMAGAGTTGIVFGGRGEPDASEGYGDVLVCRVSTGDCRLAVPGHPVDRDGDGQADQLRIVPGYGTPGTN